MTTTSGHFMTGRRARYMLRRKADLAESVDVQPDAHTNIYTHSDHARACAEAAAKKVPFKKHVQVTHDGLTQCALIIDAWDLDGVKPMWKVRLEDGVMRSFPVRNVRSCSGEDGRCLCAKEN